MKHPIVFILIVACLASMVSADKNPCHGDYKYKSSQNCTQISIPPGLCSACTSGPEQFYTTGPYRGNYIDCTRTHDLTSDAQCLVKMKEYVEENQCDTARRDGLGQYLSRDHIEKEEGRNIMDYFIYSICENACDCIPQIDASPTVPAISIERGNCQAHAHYDICRILPNIKVIKSSSKPWPDGSDSWEEVCPLLSSWISTPDGKNFRSVANTDVHPQVDTFLREFMDASQLLTDPAVYGSCLLLETAQDRVSESNEVPLFDTGASTDTLKPLSVSEAPSVASNGGTGPTKAPSVSEALSVAPNGGTGPTKASSVSDAFSVVPNAGTGSTPSVSKAPSVVPNRGTGPTKAPSVLEATSVVPNEGIGPTKAPSVSKAPSLVPNRGTGPTKAPSVSEASSVAPNRGTGPTKAPSVSDVLSVASKGGTGPTKTPSFSEALSVVLNEGTGPTKAPSVLDAPSVNPTRGTGRTKAPSVSEAPSVAPNAGAGPIVTSFTLVNAADDTDINVIENGDTIYIQPGMEINIRADTSTDSSIGSVRFALNDNANFRTEDVAPYTLAGNEWGSYLVWQFGYGPQLLKAAPYSGSGASGVVGTPLEIAFTLTDTPIP